MNEEIATHILLNANRSRANPDDRRISKYRPLYIARCCNSGRDWNRLRETRARTMRRIIGGAQVLASGRVRPNKINTPAAVIAGAHQVLKHSRVSEEVRWSNVIKVASKAVVALRLSNVRSFDGSFASCSQATGFVVDKELGLVLTNRHVVLVGPVTAEAIFENHEGVACKPIYRDPIHDFGFLKYDPAMVQYMDVGEIELHPEGAQIGKEVRVIGNDAGEKIMVLRGTISRLDREAPFYGHGYNDHDTFYITSASATSGGSSGSPVIDHRGKCIALNAGGATQASTSFFLPLDRIPRALEHARRIARMSKSDTFSIAPLARSTLHATFKHKSLDEVRRLGLPRDEETLTRKNAPNVTGMLTVGKVLPQGRAAECGMKEGDIILRISGKSVTGFVELEDIFDRAQEMNDKLDIELQRGSEKLNLSVTPDSLWSVLPNEYVEYSRGIFHPLSINLALNTNAPPNAIFVASPGYAMAKCGIPSGALLREVGEYRVSNLDDFEQAICSFQDGAKVKLRFSHVNMPHMDDTRIMTVDRKWFPMVRRKRELGPDGEHWTLKECPAPPSKSETHMDETLPATILKRAGVNGMDETSYRVLKSLVTVYFNVPFEVDGQQGSDYLGTGLIVDKAHGIIACDRNTITCLTGDVRVSVATSIELSGKPIYLHPTLNFAFVQVDPRMLQTHCDVEDIKFFEDRNSIDVRAGDELTFFGLSDQRHVKVSSGLTVSSVERANVRTPSTPRFAAKNFDVVHFDQSPSGTLGGVFVDSEGIARALWSSFFIQDRNENIEMFQATLIGPMRDALRELQKSLSSQKPIPPVYQLGLELGRIDFAEARSGYGLSDEWIGILSNAMDQDMTGASKGTREVFVIDRIMAAANASDQLRTGDILLSCAGIPVVSYSVLEHFSRLFGLNNETLPLSLLREGEVIEVEAELTPLSPLGTTKVLFFAGLQIQPTHDAVLFHGFCPPNVTSENRGCFISGVAFGSPGNSAGIFAVRWIVEVNDQEVDSLESFVEVVKNFTKSGEVVRLRLQDLQGVSQMMTLRLDLDYWRGGMLFFENGEWKSTAIN